MNHQELLPHLFRTEFRKITAVLAKTFGISHIEVAEDIASDTFLQATETWSYKGIPENPTAWLYTVAKNKARNYLNRNNIFAAKIADQIKEKSSQIAETEIDLSDENIYDSQLQMLFTLCHPSLPTEAQIGLSLRILCGFGIEEIAHAFLTNKDTINKRLFRAKEKLRLEKVKIEFPSPDQIHTRLEAVLTTLYLLFNEGYYSESNDSVLREELCLEAMRLAYLLTENTHTNTPNVNALLALMCFHASRFDARKGENGEIILYYDQNENLWNREMISKGGYYLNLASKGINISRYHLEAGIAYWHTIKTDTPEKWENILQLYNQLLIVEYSPIAALNRTYALSKVKGNQAAILEAEKLKLHDNPYYFTLLGELYLEHDKTKAKENFETALDLAKTAADQHVIKRKLKSL